MSTETTGNTGAIQQATPRDAMITIRQMIEKRKDEFTKALPKHLTVDRLMRVALTCIGKTPDLQKCTGASLCGAILQCAELGLEPGGALGHAYLVPFKQNHDDGSVTFNCTLIIGYRGLIELARRSGDLAQIEAHVVYSGDTFELEFGLSPKLRHVPLLAGNRGSPVCVYAVARLGDGAMHVEVMTRDEVEGIRKRSRAGNSGPWKTDWDEMARKTVVRRETKYLPMSSERLARALEIDDEQFVDGEVVEQTAALAAEAGKPKTLTVKERIAAKRRPLTPVDVQPGETDEQALERVANEPPPDVPLPGSPGYVSPVSSAPSSDTAGAGGAK